MTYTQRPREAQPAPPWLHRRLRVHRATVEALAVSGALLIVGLAVSVLVAFPPLGSL